MWLLMLWTEYLLYMPQTLFISFELYRAGAVIWGWPAWSALEKLIPPCCFSFRSPLLRLSRTLKAAWAPIGMADIFDVPQFEQVGIKKAYFLPSSETTVTSDSDDNPLDFRLTLIKFPGGKKIQWNKVKAVGFYLLNWITSPRYQNCFGGNGKAKVNYSI